MTEQPRDTQPAVLDVQSGSADLTLAEQAALTAGIDFWHTAAVERLGIGPLQRDLVRDAG